LDDRRKRYYRADCAGPVTINLEGCEATPKRFAAEHFSLYDGMVYVIERHLRS
jgi:hypothetical protein